MTDSSTLQRLTDWSATSPVKVMVLDVGHGADYLFGGLDSFATPNWDGYGAAPITDLGLKVARDLVAALPEMTPNPDIAAGADGSIGLEWVDGEDCIYIDVHQDGNVHLYFSLTDLGSEEIEGSVDDNEIQQKLTVLFSKWMVRLQFVDRPIFEFSSLALFLPSSQATSARAA